MQNNTAKQSDSLNPTPPSDKEKDKAYIKGVNKDLAELKKETNAPAKIEMEGRPFTVQFPTPASEDELSEGLLTDEALYDIVEDAISWGILHPDFKKYHELIEAKIRQVTGELQPQHQKDQQRIKEAKAEAYKEITPAFEDLIETATRLWDYTKPIKDTDGMTVT